MIKCHGYDMAQDAKQSEDYKFKVVQEPILHNNKPIGYFGNFRKDTGACLGITSERYGLLQNEDLLNAAYEALDARKLKGYTTKIVVAGGGERFYATFTFENKQLATALGDTVGYRLILKNSFDRSMRAAFSLAFLRLACFNGMTTLQKEFGVTQKHSSSIDVGFLGNAIENAIANGSQALGVFDLMAKTKVTDEQGQNILKHLEAGNVLSGTLRQSMETLWLAPKRKEDKARNLYNLYNAVTEHLTHQVEKDRFEYANKVNDNVLIRLSSLVRSKDKFDQFTAAVKNN